MPAGVPSGMRYEADSFSALHEFLKGKLEEDRVSIPVITGPTASGKSAMAMQIAEELDAEMISCDAMQVYRGFDIGSAKASKEDQKRILHHMLDILDPCETISVAAFTEEVTRLIGDIQKRGRRPLICGGSVQYISALLDGLVFADAPPDPDLRREIQDEIEERGLFESWQEIERLDPEAAGRIAQSDIRRISRFFELYRQTGKTKSQLNELSRREGPQYPFSAFWLDWTPRQALYDRINQRVNVMYEAGLLDELRGLLAEHPDPDACPAFRGIGYREALAHVRGFLTEEEARLETAQATRRYAKRQQTWLRRREDLFLLLHRT